MLGSLEDSALFLETCILNLEILSMMPLFQKTETKWKILTLECLLRMQLCALLSQLHRHQEALYHAQIAVRISHFLMRDLKSFIKSLVYREHILKLESNIKSSKNNMNKEIGTNDSKPTSSRIELKSNHSIESLKRTLKSPTMKSERDSKRENESNIKKGDKILDENEPIINQEDPDSIYSIENEIDTMSILLKGYKKVYPLIEFIEKYIFQEWSDDDDGCNVVPIRYHSDSDLEEDKNQIELDKIIKGKHSPNQSATKKVKIGNIIERRQRKFIRQQLKDAVREEGINAENLLGFINQKKINSYLNISNIMKLK